MAEIGETTHDEWFGDLRQGPNLDGWYDHAFVAPEARASEEATRQGIIDGTIDFTVVNTGATVSVGKYGRGLELTGKPYEPRCFTVATGEQSESTEEGKMDNGLRKEASTFHMVPDLALDPLCSSGQVCDAGYIKIFDAKGVTFYDAATTRIVTSKPPVLKGSRDRLSRLWKIPLHRQAAIPPSSLEAGRGTAACPTA